MRTISILLLFLLVIDNCFCQEEYRLVHSKEITLIECIDIALNKSSLLKIKSKAIKQLESELERAGSIFEPLLWSNVTSNKINTPADSTLDGVDVLKASNLLIDFGITKQFSTGSQVDIIFNNLYENTNVVNQIINPLYKTSMGLNIKQSILSGSKKISRTYVGEIVKKNLEIAKSEYSDVKKEIENNIRLAYFELYYFYNEYKISFEILNIIKKIENNALEKVKYGEFSKIDVLKIKEHALGEEIYCNDVNSQYIKAEIILKRDMNIRIDEPEWGQHFIPTDKYEPSQNIYDINDIYSKGISHYYEYDKQQKELEKKEIMLSVTKANNKPSLNAVAGIWANGMKDTLLDSYSQMVKFDYHTLKVGLEFYMPLRNKDKRNLYEEAKLEVDKDKLLLHDIEIKYFSDVTTKINSIKYLSNRIKTLQQINSYANERLIALKEKFNRGLISIDTILETISEIKKIRSDLNKAIYENKVLMIELERLTGERK